MCRHALLLLLLHLVAVIFAQSANNSSLSSGNSNATTTNSTTGGNLPTPYVEPLTFSPNPNSSAMSAFLQSGHLRVAVVENEPSAIFNSKTGEWSGFTVDIFAQTMDALIATNPSKYNYTYEFYGVPNGFGAYNPNDPTNWGAGSLVQEIVDQSAMAGAIAMVIEAPRIDQLDFSSPFLQLALYVTILQGQPLPSKPLSFMFVFTPELWYTLLGCMFAVALGSWILNKLSPYSCASEKTGNTSSSIWSSFNVLLLGDWEVPRSWSNKILFMYFLFMSIIVSASYTANLAAVLTAGQVKDPIASLADLARTKLPWCSRSGTVYANVLAQDKSLASTWVQGNDLPDCLKKLRANEVTAVIDFSTEADYQLSQSPCNLKRVGDPFAKQLASFQFPFHFGVVFPLNEFNRQLNTLIANQAVDNLYKHYYVDSGQCGVTTTTTSTTSMDVSALVGLFYILPIVFGMALGIIAIEWIVVLIRRKFESQKKPMPIPVQWLHQFLSSYEPDPDMPDEEPHEPTNDDGDPYATTTSPVSAIAINAPGNGIRKRKLKAKRGRTAAASAPRVTRKEVVDLSSIEVQQQQQQEQQGENNAAGDSSDEDEDQPNGPHANTVQKLIQVLQAAQAQQEATAAATAQALAQVQSMLLQQQQQQQQTASSNPPFSAVPASPISFPHHNNDSLAHLATPAIGGATASSPQRRPAPLLSPSNANNLFTPADEDEDDDEEHDVRNSRATDRPVNIITSKEANFE